MCSHIFRLCDEKPLDLSHDRYRAMRCCRIAQGGVVERGRPATGGGLHVHGQVRGQQPARAAAVGKRCLLSGQLRFSCCCALKNACRCYKLYMGGDSVRNDVPCVLEQHSCSDKLAFPAMDTPLRLPADLVGRAGLFFCVSRHTIPCGFLSLVGPGMIDQPVQGRNLLGGVERHLQHRGPGREGHAGGGPDYLNPQQGDPQVREFRLFLTNDALLM